MATRRVQSVVYIF